MAIAGKVAITPKGEWNANTAYTKLDLVFYENASYVAIQPSTGVEPTNTSYWMLVVQSAGGADLEAIINGTTQVGNAKTLDGHEAEYFFPKSGGEINGYLAVNDGDVRIITDEAVQRYLRLKNANRRIDLIVNAGGSAQLRDETNSKNIIESKLDGTNTFNGTLSTKPTGTYTGNGDATERMVDTKGIGNAVLVTGARSYAMFVTKVGGIGLSNNGDTPLLLSYAKCHFENGILTIATDSATVNASGGTYTYQVL